MEDRPTPEEGGPLDVGEHIHGGQFADIHKGSLPPDGKPCAIKLYDWQGARPALMIERLAFGELAAYAAAVPHPHLQPLVDAHLWADSLQLVFPRYDFSLAQHLEACQGGGLPFEGSRRVVLAIP